MHPILEAAHRHADHAVQLVMALADMESPTDEPAAVARVQRKLVQELGARGYRSRLLRRTGAGPHLLGVPRARRKGVPIQLVLGHADTVWPLGTRCSMPVEIREGRLHGPGTFDMKAGLTSFLIALDIIAELNLPLEADPVLFVNADEETGSPTSKGLVRRMARVADRAWVLEPPKGAEGAIKTARKGMVSIRVTAHGRPAHAGLDPGTGASAIEEVAHMVHRLHAMQDLEAGISVNAGVIRGGTRPNVVAAQASIDCDARARTVADAEQLIARVSSLQPINSEVRLEIDATLKVPPLEASPRNRKLWHLAQGAAKELGLEVDETQVGGASDGNTASILTATLDGLGWVGDGAHADHEHVVVDRIPERVALLVALLTSKVGSQE